MQSSETKEFTSIRADGISYNVRQVGPKPTSLMYKFLDKLGFVEGNWFGIGYYGGEFRTPFNNDNVCVETTQTGSDRIKKVDIVAAYHDIAISRIRIIGTVASNQVVADVVSAANYQSTQDFQQESKQVQNMSSENIIGKIETYYDGDLNKKTSKWQVWHDVWRANTFAGWYFLRNGKKFVGSVLLFASITGLIIPYSYIFRSIDGVNLSLHNTRYLVEQGRSYEADNRSLPDHQLGFYGTGNDKYKVLNGVQY